MSGKIIVLTLGLFLILETHALKKNTAFSSAKATAGNNGNDFFFDANNAQVQPQPHIDTSYSIKTNTFQSNNFGGTQRPNIHQRATLTTAIPISNKLINGEFRSGQYQSEEHKSGEYQTGEYVTGEYASSEYDTYESDEYLRESSSAEISNDPDSSSYEGSGDY